MREIRVFRVNTEGHQVIVNINDDTYLVLQWDKAEEVARAIMACARRAEEVAKASIIARDAAILLRAGVPLGLSNDPRIVEEAVKQAIHDRDLRRYLPGDVKSSEVVGVPIVVKHPHPH